MELPEILNPQNMTAALCKLNETTHFETIRTVTDQGFIKYPVLVADVVMVVLFIAMGILLKGGGRRVIQNTNFWILFATLIIRIVFDIVTVFPIYLMFFE